MQRLLTSLTKNLYARCHINQISSISRPNPCYVFINHRGIDTKKTISGLLFDHFARLKLNPFLDSKNMKPGDRLVDEIDSAIRECDIGVAVFSPRYCDSYFCLHELALLMECKKKVVPIFWDVKPSQLCVCDDGTLPASEIQRFRWALEEAKYTVGLTFDTSKGDWSEFMAMASEAVTKNLLEVRELRSQIPTDNHVNASDKMRRFLSLI